MVNRNTAHTVALIRARRALNLARPRRRIPRAASFAPIQREYAREILKLYARVRPAFAELERELPALIESARREIRADFERGDWLIQPDGKMYRADELPIARKRFWAQRMRIDAAEVNERLEVLRLDSLSGIDTADRLDSLLETLRTDAGEGKKARELIERAKTTIAGTITQDQLEKLADAFAKRTATHQRIAMNKQVHAALGADVFTSDARLPPLIDAFVDANVGLIRGLTDEVAKRVEARVLAAIQAGTLHKDLAKQLDDEFAFGEERAKLIANDQIGKAYGQIASARHREMGITRFVWRTANDRRVRGTPGGKYPKARPSHYDRNGKTYSYDDPPKGRHGEPELPGEPVRCRCTAEPVFDDILAGLDDEPITPTATVNTTPPVTSVRPKKPRKPRAPKAEAKPKPKKERAPLTEAEKIALIEREKNASALVSVKPAEGGDIASGFNTPGAQPLKPAALRAAPAVTAELQRLGARDPEAAAALVQPWNIDEYRRAVAAGDGRAARSAIRGILWQGGVLPRDVLRDTQTAGVLEVATSEAIKRETGGADQGYHAWDGRVVIRDEDLKTSARTGFADQGRVRSVIKTAVHEELHGATPYTSPAFYQGAAAAVEEATVELAARRLTARAFGIDEKFFDYSGYQKTIDSIASVVADRAGISASEAVARMTDAGIAMRSRARGNEKIPDHDFVGAFVRALPGLTDAQRRAIQREIEERIVVSG